MATSRLLLGILRQFPGYTLTTLLEEDTALLQLMAVERMGADDGE